MTSSHTTNKSTVNLTWLEQYRHITVIGLGVSGVGVIKALTTKGYKVHVQDSRENPAGLELVKTLQNVGTIHLGSFDQQGLLESDLLIVSPGVSLQTPELQKAVSKGVSISGDVDIVSRSTSVPIVAITGSNGKSTVTQLAGEICQSSGLNTFIGGNIGRSVMELLDEKELYDVAILELSSFQLETTANLKAKSAVVLNLSPDHLDRYESYQAYAQSKLAIYNGAKRVIWNREDSWLQGVELFSTRKVDQDVQKTISFGLKVPSNQHDFGVICNEQGETYFAQGDRQICSTAITSLIGTHNYLNVLAALAVLVDFDIDDASVATALEKFKGLPHRMQKVREIQGVTWVNDSKATNVGATISAISGLQGSIVLIAGGQGKGAEFEKLVPLLKKHVRRVYLLGEDSEQMYADWQHDVDCQLVASLEEAVREAHQFAEQGEIVLLAPACASFDMFKSFVARGEHFMTLVEAL